MFYETVITIVTRDETPGSLLYKAEFRTNEASYTILFDWRKLGRRASDEWIIDFEAISHSAGFATTTSFRGQTPTEQAGFSVVRFRKNFKGPISFVDFIPIYFDFPSAARTFHVLRALLMCLEKVKDNSRYKNQHKTK